MYDIVMFTVMHVVENYNYHINSITITTEHINDPHDRECFVLIAKSNSETEYFCKNTNDYRLF